MSGEDPFPKLRPAGVYQLDYVPAERDARTDLQQKISASNSLRSLRSELDFYTLGVVYKTVPLTVDPFQGFCDERNLSWTQIAMAMPRPVFAGLELPTDTQFQPNWNYLLYALPKEQWPEFCQYMGTVAFSDRKNFWRVRTQSLTILDPTKSIVAADIDNFRIPVTCFCVDSTMGCAYLEVESAKWWLPPRYVFNSQLRFEDTCKLGKAIFRESADPYGEAAK